MALCDPVGTQVAEREEQEPVAEHLDLPEGVPSLNSFYLYLVKGCNLACRHCWIVPTFVNGEPSPGEYLEVEALRAAVVEAKPLGLSHAKLTGGEPLLHPQFVEIVDLLTAEGLGMDMETNGTLIDASLARHLKEETNLTFISVSLDGAQPETHDNFRGIPGAFKTAVEGLDYLVEAGYQNVQVIMSPHRGNVDELEALVELAVEHGAGSVKLNPVTPSGRGATMHERGEALDYTEVLALTHYVLGELQNRTPIPIRIMVPPALLSVGELLLTKKGGGSCHVRHILGILGNGEMALCGIGHSVPELCFGKLGENSVREVWCTHPKLQELRQDLNDVEHYPGVCGECIHAPRCLTHCVAQNYVYGGRLVYPTALCAEAERRGEFPATRRK